MIFRTIFPELISLSITFLKVLHFCVHKFNEHMLFVFITVKRCKIIPDLNCIRENFQRFAGSTFMFSNDTSKTNGWVQEKCKCLPDCLFHAYPSEVSTGALFRDYSQKNSMSFFKDINITDQSLVHIFFNDLISTHYRKDMYQNWLGVLAAFGGEYSEFS